MNYAIVTGASRGLGAAMTEQLRSAGWSVFAVSRSRNNALYSSASEGTGVLTWIEADLADFEESQSLVDRIAGEITRESPNSVALINNAAVVWPYGVVGSIEPEAARAAVNLNVLSPIILTNAFVSAFSQVPAKKTVINISSGAAHHPMIGLTVYSATKGAVNVFTAGAALELPEAGAGAASEAGPPEAAGRFRFFAVTPGKIDTPMQEAMRSADPDALPEHSTYVEWKRSGSLRDPAAAASRVLTLLDREDIESGSFVHVRDLG